MSARERSRLRRWPFALGGLLLLLLLAVAYVSYNPFWLINRGVESYLRLHHVQEQRVSVDGNSIHYLEAQPSSKRSGKTILLVHGLGARASDWAPLIPALADDGYHVYAVDLLGYGESAKPSDGDYSLEGEERVVIGFMDALHLANADVAGWSMGGWISMLLALDHAERVHRLLLFDSAGLYFAPDFSGALFAPADRAGLDRLIARIEPDTPHLKVPAFAAPGMIRRLQANRWIVEQSYRSMVSGRDVLDFRLSRLRMPVLIVWGTEDKLTPFDQAERLHSLIPQSVLLGFRGCGHLAAAECATSISPRMLHFLQAEPPEPSSQQVLEGASGRIGS